MPTAPPAPPAPPVPVSEPASVPVVPSPEEDSPDEDTGDDEEPPEVWDVDLPDSMGETDSRSAPVSASDKTLPPAKWVPRALREGVEGDPLEALRQAWPEIVGQCRMVQPLLQHHLRDSWPVSLSANSLVIGFDPEFAGEMEQVERHERGSLRNLFHRVLGRPVHLEYTVLRDPVRWSHHRPEDDAEGGDDTNEPFDPETAGYSRKQWARCEAIRNLLETFHGEIKDIQR